MPLAEPHGGMGQPVVLCVSLGCAMDVGLAGGFVGNEFVLSTANFDANSWGNVTSHWGVDRATGHFINVSTFDTEDHAHWAPTRTDLNSRIQALGIQSDTPEFYEVAVQT